jgi:protein-S-isoprenylcysteine O-methyltransferase Ste14
MIHCVTVSRRTNDESADMLTLKGILGGLLQIAFIAALLFIPAGTWHWPRAMVFLAVYCFMLLVSIIALARFAPASLEARLQPPVSKSQPVADRIITFFIFLLIFAWLVFIPIDVFHLKLLPPTHFIVSIFGAVLFFFGFAIVMVALFQNAFAVPIVKDQSDRGHVLIDTGIYNHIRHPFYLGSILFFTGITLWLESYLSVLILFFIFALLIARMVVEEKTLRETLPGYAEYMTKVRYRLIPFIW